MSKAFDVIILGAGISGLVLGYYLKKKYPMLKLAILEKEKVPGGCIRSEKMGGFLVEKGPRTCRGEEGWILAHELGLQPKELQCKKYIFLNGKVRSWPWRFLAKAALKDLVTSKWNGEEESVEEFGKRRFGNTLFAQALVRGVFAADASHISLKAGFPAFHALEKKYRSLFLGGIMERKKERVFGFAEGMQQLPRRLAEILGDAIFYETSVQKITFGNLIQVEDFVCNTLFSTLPDPSIPTTKIEIISVCYHDQVLKYQGFGYLIPSGPLLGVIFDSSHFQENRTRLTLMAQPGLEQEQLLQLLQQHLQIKQKPDLFHRALASIPQYTLGHEQRVQAAEQKAGALSKNFHLLGNSLYGVSVNDCIKRAKYIAENSNFLL